jgi:MoaA/NifB/PqqE/SkfB family radical SAM enzyme
MHLPVVDHAAPPAEPWVGPRGQRMERLELHLTYTCPERCAFCSEEHRMQRYRPYQVTWARVATVLRAHAARGVKNIHLTGGEPTIHPQFVEVLALAKKLGMRTSVGTIGTRLADEAFAARALPLLDEGLFSLHGPSAEVHDRMAGREGSFAQVVRAMELARDKPRFGLYVNTVVTRLNVDALGDTVALAGSLGASLIVISNMTPEGLGLDRYEELAVPLERLAEVLPTIPARAPRAIVRFFGTPMCLLGDHAMLSNDLHWDPRVTVEWQDAPGKVMFDGIYSWAPDRRRAHAPECAGCTLSSVCMGVFDRYLALWPTSALRPRRER